MALFKRLRKEILRRFCRTTCDKIYAETSSQASSIRQVKLASRPTTLSWSAAAFGGRAEKFS